MGSETFAAQDARVLPNLSLRAASGSVDHGTSDSSTNNTSNVVGSDAFLACAHGVAHGEAVVASANTLGTYVYDTALDKLIASFSSPIDAFYSTAPTFLPGEPSQDATPQEIDSERQIDATASRSVPSAKPAVEDTSAFAADKSSLSGSVIAAFTFSHGKATNTVSEIWAWDVQTAANASNSSETDIAQAENTAVSSADITTKIEPVHRWGPITDSTKFVAKLCPLNSTPNHSGSHLAVLHVDGSITVLDANLERTLSSWIPVVDSKKRGNARPTSVIVWSKNEFQQVSNGLENTIISYVVRYRATLKATPVHIFRSISLRRNPHDDSISFSILVERTLNSEKIQNSLKQFIDNDVTNIPEVIDVTSTTAEKTEDKDSITTEKRTKKTAPKNTTSKIDLSSTEVSYDYDNATRRLAIYTPKSIVVVTLKNVINLDHYLGINFLEYVPHLSTPTNSKRLNITSRGNLIALGARHIDASFIGKEQIAIAIPSAIPTRGAVDIHVFDTRFGTPQGLIQEITNNELNSNKLLSTDNLPFITLNLLNSKESGESMLLTVSDLNPGSSHVLDYKSFTASIPYSCSPVSLADAIGKSKNSVSFLPTSLISPAQKNGHHHNSTITMNKLSDEPLNLDLEAGTYRVPLPGLFTVAINEPLPNYVQIEKSNLINADISTNGDVIDEETMEEETSAPKKKTTKRKVTPSSNDEDDKSTEQSLDVNLNKGDWNQWNSKLGVLDLQQKNWLIDLAKSHIQSNGKLFDTKFKEYLNIMKTREEQKQGNAVKGNKINIGLIAYPFVRVIEDIILSDVAGDDGITSGSKKSSKNSVQQPTVWPRETIKFLAHNHLLTDLKIIHKLITVAIATKDIELIYEIILSSKRLDEGVSARIIKWVISESVGDEPSATLIRDSMNKFFNAKKQSKTQEQEGPLTIGQSTLVKLAFKRTKRDPVLVEGLRLVMTPNDISILVRWCSSLLGVNQSKIDEVSKIDGNASNVFNTTTIGSESDVKNGGIVPLFKPELSEENSTEDEKDDEQESSTTKSSNTAKLVKKVERLSTVSWPQVLRIFKLIVDSASIVIIQSEELDHLIMVLGQKILNDIQLISLLQHRLLGALSGVVPEALEEQRITKELLKLTASSKNNGADHGIRYRRMLKDIQGANYQVESYLLR